MFVSLLLSFTLFSVAATAQEPAQLLLQRASDTARILTANIVLTRQSGSASARRTSGTIALMKPNYALIQLTGDDPPRALVSDGKDLYTLTDPATYTRVSMDHRGGLIREPWWALPAGFFFTQSVNPFASTPDPQAKVNRLPDEKLDGQSFKVLSVVGSNPMAYSARFYIAPNGIVQKSAVDFGDPKTTGTSFRCELSNVRLNQPLTASAFHFNPPAQAKLKEGKLVDTMLAIGDPHPTSPFPAQTAPASHSSANAKMPKPPSSTSGISTARLAS